MSVVRICRYLLSDVGRCTELAVNDLSLCPEHSFGVDPRHLAGTGDIARLFMIAPNVVSNWYARRDRNGFPLPVAQLSATPVWDLNEVFAWYGRYVPSRGGRPGSAPRSVDSRYEPSS